MRPIKRIFSTAVLAVAAGTLGLVALAFVPTLIGYEANIITSGSMGAAAPIGSVALTRMVTPASVGVGDVIVYRNQGASMTVTHRVIERHLDGTVFTFRTKGDANGAPDPNQVRTTEPIARVDRVVPFAGRIVTFARSPIGSIIFLLVPAVGLLTGGRRSRRRADPGHAPVPVAEQIPMLAVPRPSSGVSEQITWTVTIAGPGSAEPAVAGVWPAVPLPRGMEFRNVS